MPDPTVETVLLMNRVLVQSKPFGVVSMMLCRSNVLGEALRFAHSPTDMDYAAAIWHLQFGTLAPAYNASPHGSRVGRLLEPPRNRPRL